MKYIIPEMYLQMDYLREAEVHTLVQTIISEVFIFSNLTSVILLNNWVFSLYTCVEHLLV